MPSGAARLPVTVPAWLAHAYSECARIWNPIHTDIAVARAAGLPGIILHGTATLALAISQVIRHADLDPRAVRRVRASFTGMVPLPSRLTVRVLEATEGTGYLFDVLGEDNAPVLSRGVLHLV
jgi:acyl dehydratase